MTGPAVDNTPFTVWVMIPIYVVIYSIILLILEIVRKKKKVIAAE
jgi:hypothetical protein